MKYIMEKRKIISSLLFIVGLSLSIVFLANIEFPQGIEHYFKSQYYNQFGPLVISVELIIASYYLFVAHKNTNFTLALFGCTALLDGLFNQLGLLSSNMPMYGTIIISICALLCLLLAFTNSFQFNRMTIFKTIGSVVIGICTELFFNYPN